MSSNYGYDANGMEQIVTGDGSGDAMPEFDATTVRTVAGWSPRWRPVPVVCDVLPDFPHFLNHGEVPCRNPRQTV